MSRNKPPPTGAGRAGRLSWLNVGEAMAVLAVIIAGLSFWDAHRERTSVNQRERSEATARSAFVMVGTVGGQGREIDLRPLQSGEAVQSQRLVFPKAIVDHPIDVVAAQPRISADWIASGLNRLLDGANDKRAGHGRLPVAIETTYVSGDETLIDRSEYLVGYAWRDRFLAARRIDLEGLSLVRRSVRGDLGEAVERRWPSLAPKPPPPERQRAGSAPT